MEYSQCDNSNPNGGADGLFAYSDAFGGYPGGQAQYPRWDVDISGMKPGATVVVLGCGPVGLLTVKWAFLLGAERVIDCVGMDGKMSVVEKVESALKFQAGSKSAIEIFSEAVRKCGTVAMIGVYGGRYNLFPPGNFFDRNITLRMGQCHTKSSTRKRTSVSRSS